MSQGRPGQLELQFHRRGGKRRGAGRKPNGERADVSHARRPSFGRALPVHVRIVQFSVQGNHVHLVVEAAATEALSRAMQGFSIRVAKGLNGMMHRRGRVLADRYHAHPLRTPTEVRRAVAYVRNNHRKHMAQIGRPLPRAFVDPYASESGEVALPAPRTWLLRTTLRPP